MERAIRSCLAQTGDDFEIIVTDDGSTDSTVEKIEAIDDRRIHLVCHSSNLGQSAARNECVAAAVGDWLLFVDSDDELLPDALELIRRTLSEGASDIDCWLFMYQRDDGGCSPDPPLSDGILDYENYLRMLDKQIRFDPLICLRRSIAGKIPWQPWALSGSVLQRLNMYQTCRCASSSRTVGLIHTDASNRVSWTRRSPELAKQAGTDLGEEMDMILLRHGEHLRKFAPRTWQRFQGVRASFFFLAGHRVDGIKQSLRCLSYKPYSLEIWSQLLVGLMGPGFFAQLRNLRSPPT